MINFDRALHCPINKCTLVEFVFIKQDPSSIQYFLILIHGCIIHANIYPYKSIRRKHNSPQEVTSSVTENKGSNLRLSVLSQSLIRVDWCLIVFDRLLPGSSFTSPQVTRCWQHLSTINHDTCQVLQCLYALSQFIYLSPPPLTLFSSFIIHSSLCMLWILEEAFMATARSPTLPPLVKKNYILMILSLTFVLSFTIYPIFLVIFGVLYICTLFNIHSGSCVFHHMHASYLSP